MWNLLLILILLVILVIVGRLEFKENQAYQKHSKKTCSEYCGKNN